MFCSGETMSSGRVIVIGMEYSTVLVSTVSSVLMIINLRHTLLSTGLRLVSLVVVNLIFADHLTISIYPNTLGP